MSKAVIVTARIVVARLDKRRQAALIPETVIMMTRTRSGQGSRTS